MGKANCKITMKGYEKIISNIEEIGGDVPDILSKAILNSGKVATEEFLQIAKKHKYAGITEESLKTDLKVVNEGNKLTLKTGFDINKGGLASIFLDKGTPKQAPLKYVAKIKRKKKVKEALKNTLEREWEKLI